MKRYALVIAAALCLLTRTAQAGRLYVSADFQFTFHNDLTYFADAHYDYDIFDFVTAHIYGVATLNGSGQPSQYFGPSDPNHPDIATGQWSYSGTEGSCYEVYATAYEDVGGTTQGAGSPTRCAYWTPPKYTLSLWSEADGYTSGLGEDRYDEGTWVTLTAAPPTNYRFTGWTGDVTSSESSITFQLNRDMTITAPTPTLHLRHRRTAIPLRTMTIPAAHSIRIVIRQSFST